MAEDSSFKKNNSSNVNILNTFSDVNSTSRGSLQGRTQFKATEFWNEAVANIKTNVELKRKRIKLRSYAECFTGCEVVDVAYQFLTHSKENLINKEITREQAVKLCQLMLSSHVFEPVQQKVSKDPDDDPPADKFRDSNGKVYRFLDDLAKENEHSKDATPTPSILPADTSHPTLLRTNHDDIPDSSGKSVICSNIYLNDIGEEELLNITGHCKSRLSFRSLKRVLTPATLFRKTPSSRDSPASQSSAKPHHAARFSRLPPAVVDEIWREVALAHLLTLVEIPILELILGYEHTTHKHTALTFSNLALSRYASLSSLFSESDGDPWMDAAMDCLEILPDGCDVIDKTNKLDDTAQRRAIYQRIAEHYTALPQPLWSNNFADLHIALLNLLLQGRHDVVLKAVQLSLILLPSSLRDEITRLLLFIKLSVHDHHLQISLSESNRKCVERTFSRALIRSKMLNAHQCTLLVMFMVDAAELTGRCPEDTEDKIAHRLELESCGEAAAPINQPTYCARISPEEYRAQGASSTEAALVDLMNAVIDDRKLSLKEKRHRLVMFRTSHPQLFERHFSNLLD